MITERDLDAVEVGINGKVYQCSSATLRKDSSLPIAAQHSILLDAFCDVFEWDLKFLRSLEKSKCPVKIILSDGSVYHCSAWVTKGFKTTRVKGSVNRVAHLCLDVTGRLNLG